MEGYLWKNVFMEIVWMVIFSFGSLTHTWFENITSGLSGWLWLAGWLAVAALRPCFST